MVRESVAKKVRRPFLTGIEMNYTAPAATHAMKAIGGRVALIPQICDSDSIMTPATRVTPVTPAQESVPKLVHSKLH